MLGAGMSAVLAPPDRPAAPAPDFASIPMELARLAQWVLWRYEIKDSRWTKTPLQLSGNYASSTRPATWTTLADAERVFMMKPGQFDGIGFVTSSSDTTVLIDLDHVVDRESGEVAPWAQRILEAAEREDVYIERSPSGTGFHVIGHGEQFEKGEKRNDAEIYCHGRFFTITGLGVTRDPQTPLGRLVETVELVRERLRNEPRTIAKPANHLRPATPIGSDDTLLERARKARNGAKFRALFDQGDTSGYSSASEADLALASMLAFWCGKDAGAVEQLMRSSALVREKWDTRRGESTYLAETIETAITKARESYSPRRGREVPKVSAPTLLEKGDVIPAGLTVTDTDIANAKRLIDKHSRDLRYTPERGWLAWDGRRWAVDEKSLRVLGYAKRTALEIFDEVKDAEDRDRLYKHAKRSQSKNAIQAMEWLARSEAPASITQFDADPWLLNVENGTLDLRTGELRAHQHADLITKLAPVEYDREADCPTWRATLERIFASDGDIIEYLRRLVGYGLTGLSVEQVIHFMHGMGANGKSTVSELVQEMLGDYATVCSPDLIMARRHGGIPNDVARLRGVRLAMMNETGQGARFDEAKLKDLTGGDRLTARFLHAEFFDFRPTHKLIIRGNHKPAITGTDEGIWRRLRLIPFNVVIPTEDRDPYLLDKLRAELPGVLRWAVEGCLSWQRDGLKPPAAVLAAVSTYRDEADTLGRFIAESCTVRNLAQVKASAFQRAYATFCRDADERPIPSKDLPAELERRGFHYQRTNTARLYLGLELNTDDDQEGRWHGHD